MATPTPKRPKRSSWKGIPKVRCKTEGCKKRVRSHQELGICNRCANKHNENLKSKKKKKVKR